LPLSDLPQPILNDVLSGVSFKREYQPSADKLQIKELLYCLRQAYLRRLNPKPITDLKVALKIYKGTVWDKKLCGLFPVNQRYVRYHCRGCPVKINGKYDFLDGETVTELKIVDDVAAVSYVSEVNQSQVRFYAFADGKEQAQMLYFDGLDAKRFPVVVGDCSRLVNCLEGSARVLFECLTGFCRPPKTCFPMLCVNCEFRGEC